MLLAAIVHAQVIELTQELLSSAQQQKQQQQDLQDMLVPGASNAPRDTLGASTTAGTSNEVQYSVRHKTVQEWILAPSTGARLVPLEECPCCCLHCGATHAVCIAASCPCAVVSLGGCTSSRSYRGGWRYTIVPFPAHCGGTCAGGLDRRQ